MSQRINRFGIVIFTCWLWGSYGLCEELTVPPITESVPAAEADGTMLKPGQDTNWNVYDAGPFTMQFGAGLLLDTATYIQDSDSKKQMDLQPALGVRDFRLLLKGRFRDAPRLSYSLGYMYDANLEVWRFRQTGIRIEIPEWNGNIFIGRTKEGFSTSKVTTGYFGFANERPTVSDALLPIVADGIKWTGTGFEGQMVYNLGAYTYALSKVKESYYKNDQQAIVRAVWLPLALKDSKSVLHLAAEVRYGTPMEGKFQYRSKPESFTTKVWAIDTGLFPAKSSNMYGLEAYFRPGSFTTGFEYFVNNVNSEETQNPMFQGGEIFAAYMLTGEVHPYNSKGAYFEAVVPKRSAFDGGLGAFEAVLRYSYSDFNSGLIKGGRFARITPMMNWYLSEVVRLEFAYGYSVLDRFDLKGDTQYFQTRVQVAFW